ncbi:hypothetical protein RZN22_18495 [Bacillaceae bacterium S4-13-58]
MTILFTKARELMEKDYLEQTGSLNHVKKSTKAKRNLNVFSRKKTKK